MVSTYTVYATYCESILFQNKELKNANTGPCREKGRIELVGVGWLVGGTQSIPIMWVWETLGIF